MTTVNHIPDHVERALEDLPSYMQGKPRLALLITPVLQQVQRLEDAVWSAIEDRMLDSSQGDQLDQYGRLVQEPRAGLPDILYRRAIEARVIANRSSGAVDELVKIVQILTSATQVRFISCPPMTSILVYFVPAPYDDAWKARIKRLVDLATPAGGTTYVYEALPTALRTDDDSDGPVPLDIGHGAELLI